MKPTNLLARAQTFSSDKHHNTVKVLIGITLKAASHLSQKPGGEGGAPQTNKLLPGDLLMGDRGFTTHDGVALKQAKLLIPAFTEAKELDPIDVQNTREIAHVRIHVERVIGQ